MPDFPARVYEAVRRIPTGCVASYGAVAEMAGYPGAARGVGTTLGALADHLDVPWWRVLSARGEVAIPVSGMVAPLQRALLEEEGVEFDDIGRVDMRRFGWPPRESRA